MPDAPLLGSGDQQIMIASGGYALVMISSAWIAWGGNPVLSTLLSVSSGSVSGAILIAVVSWIALGLGYILVAFDAHHLVDNKIPGFGARKEIHDRVSEILRKEAVRVLRGELKKTLEADQLDSEVMAVFYEFVERPDGTWPALSAYASRSWTPYHVAMNWFLLAAIGAVVSVASIVGRGQVDSFNGVPLAIFVSTILLTVYHSQRQIRPRLWSGAAAPELVKILRGPTNAEADFADVIRARFGPPNT